MNYRAWKGATDSVLFPDWKLRNQNVNTSFSALQFLLILNPSTSAECRWTWQETCLSVIPFPIELLYNFRASISYFGFLIEARSRASIIITTDNTIG